MVTPELVVRLWQTFLYLACYIRGSAKVRVHKILLLPSRLDETSPAITTLEQALADYYFQFAFLAMPADGGGTCGSRWSSSQALPRDLPCRSWCDAIPTPPNFSMVHVHWKSTEQLPTYTLPQPRSHYWSKYKSSASDIQPSALPFASFS